MYSVHKKFGQKERNTVTKQEMMQYLSAVSDVETALYFYEEAADKLRQNRDSMKPAAVCPEKEKVLREYWQAHMPKHEHDRFWKSGIGYKVSGIVWLLIFIIRSAQQGGIIWWRALLYPLLAAGCGLVIQLLGLFIFDGFLDDFLDLQKWNKKRIAVQMAGAEVYEKQMRFYKEACEIEDKAKKEMDVPIAEMDKKCEELKLQRDQLYAMNVLHPNFQNMIAANQIREYLEMGICDELEGTNGAYALYMQDVRANRICESIDDLRQTVQEGFNEVKGKMSAVMAELRRTNANIDALNTSINSGFSDMQRAISEGQEKFNANQQASLNEANGYLRSISKTLQDAGHNEYIALKEANVSSYLRRIY